METVLRAVGIYFILLIVFRIAGRRALLQMTSFDLILLLIISEATQQALLGDDFSVTGAALTIITLVVLDITLGYIKKKTGWFDYLLDGSPVILVENGRVLDNKLKKSGITLDDILVSARTNQGVYEVAKIKFAILEKNGHISIIPFDH
ncbi:MAG TPA: DUF421 domain-containing protein [Erwinia persicina]|uniref:DUF421 domain-containing protein n=1 Tax=Erwinia persicina TaxID=55211 RepID=A0A4U3FA23_9GAMM|nr:YetF domain-containing protein [Erwinia persicina]MBC3944017.1 DUF421 domain-containing protein [Erwinia persicina]MBD8105049.1 DUF421 domain-containing protein [Erwinia persicina]MBD8208195.1 DUF421 domain-containing protein [Erwinia persicina]TKJ89615.1 DUF421 domain-containing protein [Erwinia persicina]HBH65212.1 DUF421 domain-containing protein [Erwinia persicina]